MNELLDETGKSERGEKTKKKEKKWLRMKEMQETVEMEKKIKRQRRMSVKNAPSPFRLERFGKSLSLSDSFSLPLTLSFWQRIKREREEGERISGRKIHS